MVKYITLNKATFFMEKLLNLCPESPLSIRINNLLITKKPAYLKVSSVTRLSFLLLSYRCVLPQEHFAASNPAIIAQCFRPVVLPRMKLFSHASVQGPDALLSRASAFGTSSDFSEFAFSDIKTSYYILFKTIKLYHSFFCFTSRSEKIFEKVH